MGRARALVLAVVADALHSRDTPGALVGKPDQWQRAQQRTGVQRCAYIAVDSGSSSLLLALRSSNRAVICQGREWGQWVGPRMDTGVRLSSVRYHVALPVVLQALVQDVECNARNTDSRGLP